METRTSPEYFESYTAPDRFLRQLEARGFRDSSYVNDMAASMIRNLYASDVWRTDLYSVVVWIDHRRPSMWELGTRYTVMITHDLSASRCPPTNLALFSGLRQLLIPLGVDLLMTPGRHVLWRDVANRAVQANVVVMIEPEHPRG